MVKHKALMACLILLFCGIVFADSFADQAGQVLLNGRVKNIDLPAKEVIVTDYEGKDVKLSIQDEATLDKFRDGRIKIGDDVNVKYNVKDGKNIPFSFRKLAGC